MARAFHLWMKLTCGYMVVVAGAAATKPPPPPVIYCEVGVRHLHVTESSGTDLK